MWDLYNSRFFLGISSYNIEKHKNRNISSSLDEHRVNFADFGFCRGCSTVLSLLKLYVYFPSQNENKQTAAVVYY